MAGTYNNIGLVYWNQGDYPIALEYFHKSLKITEVLGDNKIMANTYNNVGNIYLEQGDLSTDPSSRQVNYSKALEYYHESLKISEKLRDKKTMALTYNNIGIIYKNRGDFSSNSSVRQESYSKALEYYHKDLKISEELGDNKGMADTYNNIGVVYKEQGNYSKALEYYHQSLKMKEKLGDKKGIARAYNNIGEVYSGQDKYIEAIEFLNNSLTISKEIGAKDYMRYAYGILAEIYSNQNNYKAAYEYYR